MRMRNCSEVFNRRIHFKAGLTPFVLLNTRLHDFSQNLPIRDLMKLIKIHLNEGLYFQFAWNNTGLAYCFDIVINSVPFLIKLFWLEQITE